ncbi:MAG: dephospho-CoA kinase [Candidatus Omnitrophica bacterium 4484_171]|nr:MAG: dephospho-CoA kinase [Candidatus Omnitrophica bacterium 4484_171]
MPVVAVTGNLCSGKSTVVKLFKERGAKALSADKLVHDCYRDKKGDVYKKIKEDFPEVFDGKGNISRRKLARIVFTSRNLLKKLERIVHPKVIKELKDWVNSKKHDKGLYLAEVPFLFEKNLDKLFDAVIFIDASKPETIERAVYKLGISKREAKIRIANFMPAVTKKKKAHFIIRNDSDIYELRRKAGAVWEKLRKMQ